MSEPPAATIDPADAYLLSALNATDDLTVVVRAHVVFEHNIGSLIASRAPKELTELDRLNLLERVDVAIALGCLSVADRASFRVLNSLRNRFAHNLRAELTDADAEKLVASLSTRMVDTYDGIAVEDARRPASARVTRCLLSMGVLLRVNAQWLKEGVDIASISAAVEAKHRQDSTST